MQELQCDDLFIPSFLLKQPLQLETEETETALKDFLNSIQGWTEYFWIDEEVE
jgi:hypothetical protein